jgi:phosphoglycolate phosphatase
MRPQLNGGTLAKLMRRSLLFDLDGTLTDPREGILRSFRHAFERLQVPAPTDEALLKFIGPPLQDSLRTVLGPQNAYLLPDAVALYRERFRNQGMFENTVYPGIPAALHTLASVGFQLLVVTSKPTSFARSILHHFQLAECFAAIHGSELSGERSDKSELLAHVLRSHDIRPELALMIGDRSYDVIAAKQNNVGAVGVLWGYGARDELASAGADRLFSTVREMATELTNVQFRR